MTRHRLTEIPKPARNALWLWIAFFCLAVVLNGTIPFLAGLDLHAWTYSKTKSVLFDLLIYGCLFMAGPLLLVKEWSVVRQPGFLIPLVAGVTALAFRSVFRPSALMAVVVLAHLHVRYDLSSLGVRSPWNRRSLAAVMFLGLLPLAMRSLSPDPWGWHGGVALRAGLERLLLNPASTNENLFYFGLLAERLGAWAGRWKTPLLVGALYTAHEMSNPEYWYEGMNFPLVFVSVTVTTVVYLWCRNSVAIWLSSGLARFITRLGRA
jgi:hypothetical protein